MMMGVEIEDTEPGGLLLTHPHRIASALLFFLPSSWHNNIGFELAIYPTKPEMVEGLPSASPAVQSTDHRLTIAKLFFLMTVLALVVFVLILAAITVVFRHIDQVWDRHGFCFSRSVQIVYPGIFRSMAE